MRIGTSFGTWVQVIIVGAAALVLGCRQETPPPPTTASKVAEIAPVTRPEATTPLPSPMTRPGLRRVDGCTDLRPSAKLRPGGQMPVAAFDHKQRGISGLARGSAVSGQRRAQSTEYRSAG